MVSDLACCHHRGGPQDRVGRAKVYTLRGKFKQYFLRLPTEGERDCKTANLKVAPDRTLEIYVEDVSIHAMSSQTLAHAFTEPSSPRNVMVATSELTSPRATRVADPGHGHYAIPDSRADLDT